MKNIKLVEYQDRYFDKLYQMKKDNLKCYIEKVYGWNEEQQMEYFKKFIIEERKNISMLKYNDEIIGIYAHKIDENNEDFIGLLYIDKEHQRKGIGTKIIKEQLKIDKINKINTHLRVFKDNPAQNLYKRLGFKIYEETENHYKMRKKWNVD